MTKINSKLKAVTDRIEKRSKASRKAYLNRIHQMRDAGRPRPHLSCGNIAHAFAACGMEEKAKLAGDDVANIAIVSAYNDMLSAHQPYHRFLDQIKHEIIEAGAIAQMAGGVPAMCDGVTQGQPGMELSLFSRDVIAMATAVALSHNVFDGAMLFGICDKIVPGLLIGALAFGHLPFLFVPAGPMPTGISNSEKQKVRQAYAKGEVGRDALLESESRAYHSPGTCTFYGTANTNQMMLEMMGLQIPGSSFFNPTDPTRAKLNTMAAETITALATDPTRPSISDIVDAKAVVNGIAGLLATGGSTNHTIHIIAIAAAAGWHVTWQDFSDLAECVPLITRVYPNGTADVNGFHEAGATPFVLGQLLDAGLLHQDVKTILGDGLEAFALMPSAHGDSAGDLTWTRQKTTGDADILRPHTDPFQKDGGLKLLKGPLGEAVIKTSAVAPQHRIIEAEAIVFTSQEAMLDAYKAGELNRDFVAILPFQGPRACGMPELHKLTPTLGVLQDQGFHVALVTDGRMSGASGKVPAAIHVSPEASDKGPIAQIRTGDMIKLDAVAGTLDVTPPSGELSDRTPSLAPAVSDTIGRNLFAHMRATVGPAHRGGSVFQFDHTAQQDPPLG